MAPPNALHRRNYVLEIDTLRYKSGTRDLLLRPADKVDYTARDLLLRPENTATMTFVDPPRRHPKK